MIAKDFGSFRFSQRKRRRIGFFAVKEKPGERSTRLKKLRSASRIIFPEGGRKRAQKSSFVDQIEWRRFKLVSEKIAENDVIGQSWQHFLYCIDRNRREIDRGDLMTGSMKVVDASVILPATGNQDVTRTLQRSNEILQTDGHVIEVPGSSATRVTLRPEIRLGAVCLVVLFQMLSG